MQRLYQHHQPLGAAATPGRVAFSPSVRVAQSRQIVRNRGVDRLISFAAKPQASLSSNLNQNSRIFQTTHALEVKNHQ